MDEPLEQILVTARSGAGLGMVLDRKGRHLFIDKPFNRVVVQRHVADDHPVIEGFSSTA